MADSDTPTKILDAGEELFADHGYEGTSVRQIVDRAGVRLALAHYHFGSKENIFLKVIERRAKIVNSSRCYLLNGYLAESAGAPVSLGKILRAYVIPFLYWSTHADPGWRSYAKLAAHTIFIERWGRLVGGLFNPTAEIFLHEIRRTLPGVEERRIQWAFDLMVGSMCNTFGENNRIQTLSNGLCSSQDINEACSHMLPFIISGFESVINQGAFDMSGDLKTLSDRKDPSQEHADQAEKN
ncbi:MAG: TetR/AcrR family transcriptional regulator [Burkholderiaceae bacterium]